MEGNAAKMYVLWGIPNFHPVRLLGFTIKGLCLPSAGGAKVLTQKEIFVGVGLLAKLEMYPTIFQVTANNRANKIDKGNRHKIINAQPMAPKAAAQAAFINITASTPAFTD